MPKMVGSLMYAGTPARNCVITSFSKYSPCSATAAAIVLFYRTLTFWLPTIPGYGFFRYTQAKGIV